jgi:hypothetical protein
MTLSGTAFAADVLPKVDCAEFAAKTALNHEFWQQLDALKGDDLNQMPVIRAEAELVSVTAEQPTQIDAQTQGRVFHVALRSPARPEAQYRVSFDVTRAQSGSQVVITCTMKGAALE